MSSVARQTSTAPVLLMPNLQNDNLTDYDMNATCSALQVIDIITKAVSDMQVPPVIPWVRA